MIKDTKEFNVNEETYTEGSKEEQAQYFEELGNVETDLAGRWSDLPAIKLKLMKKFHYAS